MGPAQPSPTDGQSPVEKVRQRKGLPPPGERGQTRTTTFLLVRQGIGIPNPDKLTVADYRKMELDPQVRAGIQIRELAILGKPATFNYSPKNAKDAVEAAHGKRMVAFLSWVWQNLQPSANTVLRNILSARRFGFAVVEKVWASQYGAGGEPALRRLEHSDFNGFVWIEKLKLLPAESIEKAGFGADEFGNLRAVYQHFISIADRKRDPPAGVVYDPSKGQWRVSFVGPDVDRLIVYAANPEAGNWYGTSDHKAAYNYWYAKQAAHADRNILLERLSGVVYAEYTDAAGQKDLEDALDNVGPGGVLTVPAGSAPKILAGWEGAIDGYHESLRYDDFMILRAYLVPPLAAGGGPGETGSFARAETELDTFLLTIRSIQFEVEEIIEKGFTKPLIDANFGPQEVYPTFDFPELAEADREKLSRVWSTAIGDGYVDPAIDAHWLRQEMGVPEEAPSEHVFERPVQAGPFGSPRVEEEKPVEARREVAAAHTEPLTEFERADANQSHRLTVEALEATAKARIAEAANLVRDQVLARVPESAAPAELAKIRVPADWLKTALDDLARDVLARVWRDMAATYRRLGNEDLASQLEAAVKPKTAAKRSRATLAAANLPAPVLESIRSYTDWSTAMNEIQGERAAAELASRLRLRVLQSYSTQVTQDEVARVVADEFSSYTLAQLRTVSRTTVMDLYNSARNASIDAAGDFVGGVKLVPLIDAGTTPFCRALEGRTISKGDPLYERLRNPPYDYGCRTTVIPILGREDHEFDADWESWWATYQGVDGGDFAAGRL